jgi:hypothetical protein
MLSSAAGKSHAFCRRQRSAHPPTQPAKVTPFAGGNMAHIRKSAAGDFCQ